jgi:transaldolase
MEAYLAAMEERVAAGRPVDHMRSVASFFVSRVDTKIDHQLDSIAIEAGRSDRHRRLARESRGKAAIANARLAYEAFGEIFQSSRFAALRKKGVRLQRPLWASMSTKDRAYPALYYVEALVAPDSVSTLPPATFEEYRNHGNPEVRIHDDLPGAHALFQSLAELTIEEERVASELEEEGAAKFVSSYQGVLEALDRKREAILATR